MRDEHAETIARYIALADLVRDGNLDDLAYNQIAIRLGVNRSNIGRNMRVLLAALPLVEEMKRKILKEQ